MSIEMDAGVHAPSTPFNAAAVEDEAAKPDPSEGWLMLLATLVGVVGASVLGVLVYLG